jgi:hypothetical protein
MTKWLLIFGFGAMHLDGPQYAPSWHPSLFECQAAAREEIVRTKEPGLWYDCSQPICDGVTGWVNPEFKETLPAACSSKSVGRVTR